MEVKKKSLVVFHNGEVIASHTHNDCIDQYAERYDINKVEAYTCKHVLSMLKLIEHDIADVIMHIGEPQKCIDILHDIGITIID